MYETYYGFREKPFSLVPDPDFLYLGRNHRTALNILEYGLRGEASFALISGEVGSGKTILIRRFLRMVDQQTTIGLITNTHASLGNLLDWILLAFNLDYRGKEKVELFEILTNFLLDQRARGRRTILIIDEAQNMEFEMLEELRMLSNINVDKDLMFQIVLAGQPEILDKINRPELRQLAQRISAHFHLSPLTLDETRDYICHRLTVAGGRPGIFDNLACAAVYHFTEGLPRPINILCDSALVYGFGEDQAIIGLETILDVVEDVQRSGLKALRALEEGFDRQELTEKITELAKTYVHPEPLQDDPEVLQLSAGPPTEAGPTSSQRAAADPGGSGAGDARPFVPLGSGAVRDVPSGIPPLNHAGDKEDRWRPDPDDKEAAKTKKWRRLFDVSAAAVLVLVLAAFLLRGLDIWPGAPVSDDLEAARAGGNESGAELSEAGAEPEPSAAEPSETATAPPQSANGDDEEGLLQSLLSAVGWSGKGTETAVPDDPPAQTPSATVTITLESSDEARQPDRPEPHVELVLEDQSARAEADENTAGEDAAVAEETQQGAGEATQTAALPPTVGAASDAHWIRLGTFRHEESAPIQWRQLQRDQADLLANLSHRITKVERAGQDPLYLLNAGPLPDEEASKTLCRSLTIRGVDCLALRGAWTLTEHPEAAPDETRAGALPLAEPAPSAAGSRHSDLYKMALIHSQDGQTYSKNGDFDRAIREFNAAIRLDPGLASAYYNRGEIHFKRGDYREAIRDFTNTIRLAPDYTFAYYSRGVANEKLGEIEEAILDYTHTVRLKPSYAPAYNDRARTLLSLGHLREALRDSELAISVAPDTPSYLATHSQILAALGRDEGALATLEKAMAVADAEWIKRYQLAMSRDGFYRGPIDGRYGPATKSAMRACLDSGCALGSGN